MKLIILVALVFGGNLSISAAQKCAIKSTEELFSQIKRTHPLLKQSGLKAELSHSREEAALERPNPKFTGQYLNGDDVEGETKSLQIKLAHTFETGDKRERRAKLAKSMSSLTLSEIEMEKDKILINVIEEIYHLRHVREVLPIYTEALKTFKSVFTAKKKQKSLSPGESVDQDLIALEISNYSLKISELLTQKSNIERKMNFYLGKDCSLDHVKLPEEGELYAVEKVDLLSLKDSRIDYHNKMIRVKETQLKVESAKAYPNIDIGPMFQNENIAGVNYQRYGVSLNFNLPVLNQNDGRRALKRKELEIAKKNFDIQKMSLDLQLESWKRKYREKIASLRGMVEHHQLNRTHEKIDRLYSRGVISTAQMIDSHRKFIEYFNTRHEFEISAVFSLWNIFRLTGRLWTEKIEIKGEDV